MCAALFLSLRLEQRAHTESPIQALEEEEEEEEEEEGERRRRRRSKKRNDTAVN